jgi:hypothetical protein
MSPHFCAARRLRAPGLLYQGDLESLWDMVQPLLLDADVEVRGSSSSGGGSSSSNRTRSTRTRSSSVLCKLSSSSGGLQRQHQQDRHTIPAQPVIPKPIQCTANLPLLLSSSSRGLQRQHQQHQQLHQRWGAAVTLPVQAAVHFGQGHNPWADYHDSSGLIFTCRASASAALQAPRHFSHAVLAMQ